MKDFEEIAREQKSKNAFVKDENIKNKRVNKTITIIAVIFLFLFFGVKIINIAFTPYYTIADSNSKSISIQSDLTIGQRNALQTAKSYLSHSAFSRGGLVGQLEFEGYETADAEYAVNNCGADWNEQALKCAKSYLHHTAFSYNGLIHQLEFEEFTTEQATYGADNCGADWNEQAAKCAKSYLSHSSFSRNGLIRQLEFEGFTHEQAVYGVEQNGY